MHPSDGRVMGGRRERTFKAEGLSESEWDTVEKARSDAKFALGVEPTNKELLLLLVNDTAPSWRQA